MKDSATLDETAEPKKARTFRPKNDSQSIAWRLMETNDITVLMGSPGTGKSFLAAAYAVSGLRSGEYDSIVVLRGISEAGRSRLGYLPGDASEKTMPYMRPVKDAIKKLGFEPDDKQTIECLSVGFIQGLTFDNAVVICDESQTLTVDEIKLVIGRLGKRSKLILTGDPRQDIGNVMGGLRRLVETCDGLRGLAIHRFEDCDIVRHGIIAKVFERMEKGE